MKDNDEPKMLSDYFKTDNGKKTLEILQTSLRNYGEQKCRDRAYAYLILEMLLEGLGDQDGFDMEVDEGLFHDNPSDVAASVITFVHFNDSAPDILSTNTDCSWRARETAWADYRA